MKLTILFLGLFGLFAQAFNGSAIGGVSVAAISLLLIFGISFFGKNHFRLVKLATQFLAFISVLACIYDAYAYYSKPQISGNYYGGFIWSIPVAVCLIIYTRNLWLVSVQQKKL